MVVGLRARRQKKRSHLHPRPKISVGYADMRRNLARSIFLLPASRLFRGIRRDTPGARLGVTVTATSVEKQIDTPLLLVSGVSKETLRRNSAMRRNYLECGGIAAKIVPSDPSDTQTIYNTLRRTTAERERRYGETHSSAVYPRLGSRYLWRVGMGVEPTSGYKTLASTAVRGTKDVS